MSIMAHEVVVMPYKTFRLNTTVCVAGDTTVDCGGYERQIDEIEDDWEDEAVTTYDPGESETRPTDLQDFMALDPAEYGATVHEIETEFGSVVATSDHPFETPDGPVPVENLEPGDVVLRRPIDLPEFQPEAAEQMAVTEADVREAAPDSTYVAHTMRTLGDLVPFDAHSREGVAAARLAGHLFGDGTLELQGQTGRLFFRADRDDLDTIRDDLELLGFEPEAPVLKHSSGQVVAADGGTTRVEGSGWSMKIGSKPLASFMAALGVPAGDKVEADETVPDWIKTGPKAVKRAFLSAYFGAELSTPSYRGHKLFRQPVFKLSRTEDVLDAGKQFVEQIDDLLGEFGTGVSNVRVQAGNRRSDGRVSQQISAELAERLDLAPSTDTIGPIAPDVETAARVLDSISGYSRTDSSSSRVDVRAAATVAGEVPDARVGVLREFLAASHDAVVDVIERCSAELESLKRVDVVPVELGVDLSQLLEAASVIIAAEAAWVIRQNGVIRGQGTWYNDEWRTAFAQLKENGFSKHIASRLLPGAYLDAATDGDAYQTARSVGLRFQDVLQTAFEDVDALLTPTMRIPPPDCGEFATFDDVAPLIGNTTPFSLAGTPAISVPAGSVDGRPVGAQVVTPWFEDAFALQVCRSIEQARS